MFDKTMMRGVTAALAAVFLASAARAEVIYSPYETTPGNTYQIAFVTSGYTTAESADINDYNAFVTAQAALGTSLPAATWSALASTPTVDALANAPTYSDVPIYNTLGQLIASGSAELWSGVLENPIDGDQYGLPPTSYVWTGTNSNGTAAAGLGTVYATVGLTNTGFAFDFAGDPTDNVLSMYALSSPITVPTPVPEPAVLTLLGAGMLAWGAVCMRRRTARLEGGKVHHHERAAKSVSASLTWKKCVRFSPSLSRRSAGAAAWPVPLSDHRPPTTERP